MDASDDIELSEVGVLQLLNNMEVDDGCHYRQVLTWMVQLKCVATTGYRWEGETHLYLQPLEKRCCQEEYRQSHTTPYT